MTRITYAYTYVGKYENKFPSINVSDIAPTAQEYQSYLQL